MNYFKKTIGFVDPAEIIAFFMDASHCLYLAEYLEDLVQKSSKHNNILICVVNNMSLVENHKYYCTLLLNCYVSLNNEEKINKLITSGSLVCSMIDINQIIDSFIASNNPKFFACALNLAMKARNIEQQIKIQINMHDYKTALAAISQINDLDFKVKQIIRFGEELKENIQKEFIEFMLNFEKEVIQLSKKDEGNKEKYRYYLKKMSSILIDSPDALKKFLELQIKEYADCQNITYHHLIELLLEESTKLSEKKQEDKLMELLDFLNAYKGKYDETHILILFQRYNFSQGIEKLNEISINKLSISQDILVYYMQKNDYANVLNFCKKSMNADFWIQALRYFIKMPKDTEKYINDTLTALWDS